MSPSGGLEAFLEMNFKACLKLQYVSGYLGLTSKIFIGKRMWFLQKYEANR